MKRLFRKNSSRLINLCFIRVQKIMKTGTCLGLLFPKKKKGAVWNECSNQFLSSSGPTGVHIPCSTSPCEVTAPKKSAPSKTSCANLNTAHYTDRYSTHAFFPAHFRGYGLLRLNQFELKLITTYERRRSWCNCNTLFIYRKYTYSSRN